MVVETPSNYSKILYHRIRFSVKMFISKPYSHEVLKKHTKILRPGTESHNIYIPTVILGFGLLFSFSLSISQATEIIYPFYHPLPAHCLKWVGSQLTTAYFHVMGVFIKSLLGRVIPIQREKDIFRTTQERKENEGKEWKSWGREKNPTFSSPNFRWKLWIWSKLINQASFIIKRQESVLMLVISL